MSEQSYFRRVDASDDGRPPTWPFACEAGSFGKKYEWIFAYLALLDDNGKPRKPGRVTLFTNGVGASVVLTDGSTGDLVFSDGPDWDIALCGLEEALQKGTAVWKAPRERTQFRRKMGVPDSGT